MFENGYSRSRWQTQCVAAVPIVMLLSVLSFLVVLEPSDGVVANAALPKPADADNDILPDTFELIFGTNYLNPDSDGDGVPDGVEFAMCSRPLDPFDNPVIEPGIRLAVYQEGLVLKTAIIMFPSPMEFIENFDFVIAYPLFAGDDITGFNMIPLTEVLPFMLTEATSSTFQGLTYSCYVMDLPMGILFEYAPLSLGTAAKFRIDDVISKDVADLNLIDGVPVRLLKFAELGMESIEKYYGALTPNPPPDWSNDQVCNTELEVKESKDGVTTYEVTDSSCGYSEDQSCSSGKCADMQGSEVISIDPGFLESRVD
ncbi:MAG: hypothetical protein ACYTG7_17525 [Planctomycetota bacterium]|jgi:hypothetical protein